MTPSTFGPVAFLKPSGDIHSNNESPSQSVLPALSEGIFESNLQNHCCLDTAFDGWQYAFKFLNLLASECSSLMSHRGVAMLIPGFVSPGCIFSSLQSVHLYGIPELYSSPRGQLSTKHLVDPDLPDDLQSCSFYGCRRYHSGRESVKTYRYGTYSGRIAISGI